MINHDFCDRLISFFKKAAIRKMGQFKEINPEVACINFPKFLFKAHN